MPRAERTIESTAGHGAALRLAVARGLAWALLIGGWLSLGTLGRQQLPQTAGGLAPVALWLAALGAALALAQRRAWTPTALRGVLLGTGLLLAAACATLTGSRPLPGLILLAIGWALLLVAASLSVRLLRRAAARAPSPVLPALAGAALACAWAAPPWPGPFSAAATGAALPGIALVLALLLPRRAVAVTACRAGLFDCALALAPLVAWRRPAAWPQAAASLAMLPMMATLAWMADWCSGAGFAGTTAAHLAAMLLPALLVQAWPAQWRAGLARGTAAGLVAALMVLGGLALAWPGLFGLMAAGLLHGAAWGLVWALRWAEPRDAIDRRPAAPGRAAAALPAAVACALVLALGWAIAQWGPTALLSVHAALALLGTAGGLAWLRQVPDHCVAQRRSPSG